MKAYYSHWSLGNKEDLKSIAVDCVKLSAHLSKKIFSEIHLITDKNGKKHLGGLADWDSVSTELESLDGSYRCVWSLGKLLAYKIIAEKGEPFIHIDHDVFLWKPLNDSFINSPIFAQSPEETTQYFYGIPEFVNNCPRRYAIDYFRPDIAYNVGIFGGYDLDFIREYADDSIKMVLDKDNRDFWINFNGMSNPWWQKATIAEQYYLSVMLSMRNKKIKLLFEDGWPDEQLAVATNYTHLMSTKCLEEVRNKIKRLADRIKV